MAMFIQAFVLLVAFLSLSALAEFIKYQGAVQPSKNNNYYPSDGLGFWQTNLTYVRQVHPQVWIQWTPDKTNGQVIFAMAVNTLGYLAYGLTETGGMIGASICAIHWDESAAEVRAFSYFSGNYTYPTLSDAQTCVLLNYTTYNGESMAVFSRPIVGCKPQELDIIEEWDQRWIFAWGTSMSFGYHSENRGTTEFNAILGPPQSYDLPADAVAFPLLMEPHEVPSHRNVYTCRPTTFPTDRRYHIVKTEPVLFDIYPAKYHHFNIFNCPAGHPPEYQDGLQKQCNSPVGLPPMACFQFFTTWLTGQGDVWFMDAGLPIGAGGNGAAIDVVIQEHIDNTYETPGLYDEGWGMLAWYTPTLREEECGNIGMFTLLPISGIPINQEKFLVDSHCGPGCTEFNVPASGVTVISVSPHAHFAARGIGANLIRYNESSGEWVEQPLIHQLTHWDANWQGVRHRRQNLVILPGDRIRMFCYYNTIGLTEPVFNGEGYEDEMCLLPITIRPRLEQMTACGSFQDENGGGRISYCDGYPFAAASDSRVPYLPLPEQPNNCPA